MIGFIIRYIIIACVVLVIPRYLKGITVDGFTTALLEIGRASCRERVSSPV